MAGYVVRLRKGAELSGTFGLRPDYISGPRRYRARWPMIGDTGPAPNWATQRLS